MEKPILIIGDIVVDVTIKTSVDPYKLRLGGIVHAARGLWALDKNYRVGFFAPKYLDKGINSYLTHHNCKEQVKLGEVIGAPYVFLIEEAKETGNQGYEFLLREEIQIVYEKNGVQNKSDEEVFLVSGNYELKKIVSLFRKNSNIHIDLANNIHDVNVLQELGGIFSTIFVSTSSDLFKKNFCDDFHSFVDLFRPYTKRIVLKENRGGSRGFDFTSGEIVDIPSQTQPIIHSVGVGDVFDATYISTYANYSFKEALFLSSWVASEYALTTFPDDFKTAVQLLKKVEVNDLIGLGGVFIPWEKRKEINIYIAAPDFDFIDTTEIDRLASSLSYHNFSPRRPIKENGQMEEDADSNRKRELFDKDMVLLHQCKILVAVILGNDPGTLVEIGYAVGIGIPVLVYDPHKTINNCMASELPTMISDDLDCIISEVFRQASKIYE